MDSTATRPAAMTTAARVTSLLFYGGLLVALLVIATRAQHAVLPGGLARQLGHNSEALALAVAVAGTLQFARPRWLRQGPRRVGWGLVFAVATVWIALGVGVYYLDVPGSVKTLNEPLLAAGLLTMYAAPPRPLRRSWLVPGVIVVAVVIGFDTSLVQAQAESVTALVAVALSLDLVDRRILSPRARESSLVWAWYLLLTVWPAFMLVLNRTDLSGALGSAVDYQARGAEGFWGALLVCLFFRLLRHLENTRGGRQAPSRYQKSRPKGRS